MIELAPIQTPTAPLDDTRLFEFEVPADIVHLDQTRKGIVKIAVTNVSDFWLRGRAILVAEFDTAQPWLSLQSDAEHDIASGEQTTVSIVIQAPNDAEAGLYRFRLDFLNLALPDETLTQSDWVTFEVLPLPQRNIVPWLAGAAVVILVIAAAIWWLNSRVQVAPPPVIGKLAYASTQADALGIFAERVFTADGTALATAIPISKLTMESVVESPDGKFVVFSMKDSSGIKQLYRADYPTGANRELLSKDRNGSDDQPTIFQGLGQFMVGFVSDRDSPNTPQIYVMSLADRTVTRITNSKLAHAHPIWSPDGNRIAFDSDTETPGRRQIYVATKDGKSEKAIATPKDLSADQPRWLNASILIYGASTPAGGKIFRQNIDTNGAPELLSQPNEPDTFGPFVFSYTNLLIGHGTWLPFLNQAGYPLDTQGTLQLVTLGYFSRENDRVVLKVRFLEGSQYIFTAQYFASGFQYVSYSGSVTLPPNPATLNYNANGRPTQVTVARHDNIADVTYLPADAQGNISGVPFNGFTLVLPALINFNIVLQSHFAGFGFTVDSAFPSVTVAAGSVAVPFASFPLGIRDTQPTWKQDATQIAFASNREGKWQIFAANADGSAITRLTDGTSNAESPRWSKDGRFIAFVSSPLPAPGATDTPSSQLVVMNTTGNVLCRFTTPDFTYSAPMWSPDGKQIAVTMARRAPPSIPVVPPVGPPGPGAAPTAIPAAQPAQPPSQIVLIDISYDAAGAIVCGSALRNLSSNSVNEYSPAFSPDGKQLAFISTRDGVNPQVYVQTLEGTQGPTRISNLQFGHSDPWWSPDGKQLLFELLTGNQRQVNIMNADGTNYLRLSRQPFDIIERYPTWVDPAQK